jgi:hypothetical protein
VSLTFAQAAGLERATFAQAVDAAKRHVAEGRARPVIDAHPPPSAEDQSNLFVIAVAEGEIVQQAKQGLPGQARARIVRELLGDGLAVLVRDGDPLVWHVDDGSPVSRAEQRRVATALALAGKPATASVAASGTRARTSHVAQAGHRRQASTGTSASSTDPPGDDDPHQEHDLHHVAHDLEPGDAGLVVVGAEVVAA